MNEKDPGFSDGHLPCQLTSPKSHTSLYKASQSNGNTDALSRFPFSKMPHPAPFAGEANLLMAQEHRYTVTISKIGPIGIRASHGATDHPGRPMANGKGELHPFFSKRTELGAEDGRVLWGARVVVETHPKASRMKALARSYVWWPGIDQDIVKGAKCCDKCQFNQSVQAETSLQYWD